MTKILGIDQSMNCTGVCLHTINGDKHTYKYWMIIPTQKMTKKLIAFKHHKISIINYEKLSGEDYVSRENAKALNVYTIVLAIRGIIKMTKPDLICMEGISYGSVGSASLADLAGLNYGIRMGAIDKNIEINIISPMDLKKRATGNGGADKDEMVWAWRQCDPKIKDVTDIKVDDLADAFFLSQCNIK